MNQTIKKRIEEINNGIVPEGYEKTSFGIFPCDWERDIKFGELFDFYGGLGKSREELGDQGVCYLHYGDMHTNTFNKVTYEQYSRLPRYDIALNGNETFLMQDGDIAFLDASEDLEGTSRAVLIDNVDNKPFIAGLHTILAKEKQSVFSKYYKQYITISQDVKKQFQKLAVGFKVYGLNRESIKKIKISYPKSDRKSDSEQSRIAEILMQWDKAIELQEKYIKQLEFRKKAIMQRLLTPQEGINKLKLVELVKMLTSGGTPITSKAQYYDGDIVWVSIEDMSKSNKYISNSIRKITLEGLDNSSAKLFPKGTVLYAMYASIGKCVIAERECATSQAILGILCDENKLYNEYLYYYLCSIQEKIILQGQKGVQANLKKEMVAQFSIPVKIKNNRIDICWQKNIANILSQTDQGISLQKQKLQKLIVQRKAMQQYLLTGIVRV